MDTLLITYPIGRVFDSLPVRWQAWLFIVKKGTNAQVSVKFEQKIIDVQKGNQSLNQAHNGGDPLGICNVVAQ